MSLYSDGIASGKYRAIEHVDRLAFRVGARVDLDGALGIRGTVTGHYLGTIEVAWDNGHENAHAPAELVELVR